MLTLPRELAHIVASYLHNGKQRIHKELRDLSYTFVRNHYLGRVQAIVTHDGRILSAPYWTHPVFEDLPARLHWPPLNYHELRERMLIARQYTGVTWI